MLSPGRYHEVIPRDLPGNLRFRKWLLIRCQQEKSYRRAVIEMCRQDILFHINAFCVQYNPKKPARHRFCDEVYAPNGDKPARIASLFRFRAARIAVVCLVVGAGRSPIFCKALLYRWF